MTMEKAVEAMPYWSVTVSINGDAVLTIEPRLLSGIENISDYEEQVRQCALHLLSFIGDRDPAALPALIRDAKAEAWEEADNGIWAARIEEPGDMRDKHINEGLEKAREAIRALATKEQG